ncbi:hypothetical protein OEZ86_005932 [Tetradesmus obliquus]|nr:hypothetical protein OEZ86_005932 [Tetradesmus obliquus]
MLGSTAVKALAKQLQELQSDELRDLGIRVTINEADVTDIQAEIDGPPGTPFDGGMFRMRLSLPADFPASPPKGFFTTKIWHPNVSKSGEICVNVLKRDWKPELGIRHVLQVIRCLLIEPYPESALNEEAGKALLEDYAEYEKYARLMTSLHAQQPAAAKRHMPLTTSTGANASSSAAGEAGPSGSGSPALKKPKPELKAAASKVKKSLKRL